VQEPLRAVLEVEDYAQFVATQVTTVLKAVCSKYPYESSDPGQPCLKHESDALVAALTEQLQAQVNPAGVSIALVHLNDLAYAPEIAQAMLLRQQAQALVDARRTLVEGAVSTVSEGIALLEQAQIHLSPSRRNHLISNLSLLLCAGERGEPLSTVVTRTS
jgi:regulator of protease activity HflC (stomatin/prohibitin superfamily)